MPEQPIDALSGNDFGRDTPNATAEMIELLLADDRCWHKSQLPERIINDVPLVGVIRTEYARCEPFRFMLDQAEVAELARQIHLALFFSTAN